MGEKRTARRVLTAFVLFCAAAAAPALAYGSATPIGDGSRFVCIHDGGSTFLGRRSNGAIVSADSSIQLRLARSKVALYRFRLREAKRRGASAEARRARALLDKWSRILQDMLRCLRTTAPTPLPASACTAFAPSLKVYPRIINGTPCSGASAVVEVILFDIHGTRIAGCSGAAVAENAVVTAAHCFSRQELGTDAAQVQVSVAGQTFRTGEFHIHPGFNINALTVEVNDVAVVILPAPLAMPAMPLLAVNDLSAGEPAAIAGYGVTQSGGQQGLRAGFMTLTRSTSESIIATYDGEGSDTCLGDSGGPLAVERQGRWVLAGITSNGDNQSCGLDGRPDVASFTNLSSAGNRAFLAQWLR